jgi:hypothetical protein
MEGLFKSNNMNNKLRLYLMMFVIMVIGSSCIKDDAPSLTPNLARSYDASISIEWVSQYNELIRNTPGQTVTVSSRSLALLGLAMYEAVVPGMPEYNSLQQQIPGITPIPVTDNNRTYDWNIALNSAAAELAMHIFVNASVAQQESILNLETTIRSDIQLDKVLDIETVNRSIAHGKAVANAIIQMDRLDPFAYQGHENLFDPSFPMPDEIGKWQPEPPLFLPPITPRWGQANTLIARKNTIEALPPPVYSNQNNSPYFRQIEEILDLNRSLSEDQRHMAEFWNDMAPEITMGPSGRWMAITSQIITQQNLSLDQSVLLFAKVGLALFDASVACWSIKFQHITPRPVNSIREMIDPEFMPYMYAFQSPEYISEHAMLAAAAAEILTIELGNNISFTDRCHENRTDFNGTPRSYSNFRAAAQEAAYSRMYAGANIRSSCDEGLRLGKTVGNQINFNIQWKQ